MADLDTTARNAKRFADLHKAGDPLLLFNCWDVVTAKAAAKISPAIATGSAAVAFAQGYDDGQKIPLDYVMKLTKAMVDAVDCPVSVDFEAGYADSVNQLKVNVSRLIENGVVGINYEDSLANGKRGMVDILENTKRIEAIREAADKLGVALFINARTDAYLLNIGDAATCLSQTLERARHYQDAGASGIFVPFLNDRDQIGEIADTITLPLNVLGGSKAPSVAELSELGVARISLGGWPMEVALKAFSESAKAFTENGKYPDT